MNSLLSRFCFALIFVAMLVVAGKTYVCHVAEEMRDGIQIKTWTSDKVPGGLVKMELRGDGTLMTTLLVESSIQK